MENADSLLDYSLRNSIDKGSEEGLAWAGARHEYHYGAQTDVEVEALVNAYCGSEPLSFPAWLPKCMLQLTYDENSWPSRKLMRMKSWLSQIDVAPTFSNAAVPRLCGAAISFTLKANATKTNIHIDRLPRSLHQPLILIDNANGTATLKGIVSTEMSTILLHSF